MGNKSGAQRKRDQKKYLLQNNIQPSVDLNRASKGNNRMRSALAACGFFLPSLSAACSKVKEEDTLCFSNIAATSEFCFASAPRVPLTALSTLFQKFNLSYLAPECPTFVMQCLEHIDNDLNVILKYCGDNATAIVGPLTEEIRKIQDENTQSMIPGYIFLGVFLGIMCCAFSMQFNSEYNDGQRSFSREHIAEDVELGRPYNALS